MFDIQTTLKWITDVFTDPDGAASRYRETSATWQQSAATLTVPIYVAAYLFAAILALITGGSLFMGSLSLGFLLFSVLWAIGWTFVMAFIFDYASGTFGGRRDFDAAYAVVALAIVPAAAGVAATPLPWLGWLIGLAAFIYSLVLAYRFLPLFLEIPEAARVKHFAASVVAALVLNVLVWSVFGNLFFRSMVDTTDLPGMSGRTAPTGMLGGLERQADFMEAASRDTYDPPADGKLSEDQVETYVGVLKRTRALRKRLEASLEGMDDREPSLTEAFSGMGNALRLGTAEMEVVKTAGGNWAEHQWVKSQLETARVQQDLNETTEHNYRLFLEYEEEIEPRG